MLSTSVNAFFCTHPPLQGEVWRDGGSTLHSTHFSLYLPDCKEGNSLLSFTTLMFPRHTGFLHIPPFLDLMCTPSPVSRSDPKPRFQCFGVMCFLLALTPTCQERLGEATTPACACSSHPPGAWQVSQVLPGGPTPDAWDGCTCRPRLSTLAQSQLQAISQ